MGSISNSTGICVRREEDTETPREEGHVTTEAAIAAMHHQPRTVWSHQKLGGQHVTHSPSEAPGGTNLTNTLTSDLRPPKLGESKFLLF